MTPASRAILLVAAVTLAAPAVVLRAQSAKDLKPFRSTVYNVTFGYPKKDWIPVPAAGGNIALVMQKKGEASLALDYQVLRVALAPDEIDDTFLEIEIEALTQRAPHARVIESELTELGGRKTVVIHYGAAGLAGDLDVRQYSIVEGAALYRLTCAVSRSRIDKHGGVCELAAQSLAINEPS